MSLTSCIKQAGDLFDPQDRASVFAEAKRQRTPGSSPKAVGLAAIDAVLEQVQPELAEAEAALVEAKKPPPVPVQEAAPASRGTAGAGSFFAGWSMDMGWLHGADYKGINATETTFDSLMVNSEPFEDAVFALRSLGLGYLLDKVGIWHVTKGHKTFAAAVARVEGVARMYLNEDYMGDAEKLQFIIAHELGHVADYDGYSEDQAFNLHRGADGRVRGIGEVANEVVNWYEQHKTEPGLANTLRYPLAKPKLNNNTTRSELFAQLWATFSTPEGKALMRDQMPLAAAFMEVAYESSAQEGAVQGTVRQGKGQVQERTAKGSNVGGQAGRSGALQRMEVSEEALTNVARRVAGPSGAMAAADVSYLARKLGRESLFLHDLVDRYKAAVPAMGKWYEGMQAAMTTRRQMEQEAERIAIMAEQLKNGTARVNDFIGESTIEQKWGYDPKFADKTVTVDAATAAKFGRLSPEEQAVVKAVFAHGHKMVATKRAILKAAGINDEFTKAGALDGPYSPLKRFGNFIAVLKSQELINAGETAAADKLKADPAHYLVSAFDTPGQAKQFAWANARANGGQYDFTDSFPKDQQGDQRPDIGGTLQKVLAALGVNDNIPPEVRSSVEEMVRDMYFQSIDEHHARTSGLRRMNRAGYDADMMRSFLSGARAEAAFLANIKHGKEISGQFLQTKLQAKNPLSGQRDAQEAVNTIAAHYADSLSVKETPIQDRAVALTSAWQLMTSIGYHVTNAMQGIMVTIPKLGADLNDYSGAWKHLMDGYGIVKQVGMGALDLSKVTDTGLRAALQRAADMGVLDVGMDEDLTQFSATRTGINPVDKTSAVARSALHKLRGLSRMVETANRVSSATAAYRMALSKGKTVQEAQDYAVSILQSTQGDFSRVGSPLILKKLPKVITQYRKYQFMMAALYVKAFQQAFSSADPKERAIGRRMLAFKLFHTSMAAGALGLPMMNLASLVFSAFGGDDEEPADMERSLREWIGDPMLADLLLRGPLNMIGLDMSAKLGDDKIFSIMPYTDWNFSSAQDARNTITGLMGPGVSQLGKWADGVGFMSKGEYYKGVEKLVPKGLESAMRASRIANEGYTLKNGDVMFTPEETGAYTLALDAIGLSSTQMKRMDWLRSQQYEVGEFFQNRTKEITRKYVTAMEDGDSEEAGEARDEWMALQASKDNLRSVFNDSPDALKKSPLSVLLRAPKTAAKREARLQEAAALVED